MCGIAGLARLGKEPIAKEQLINLLLGVEHRGADATGVALMTGNTLAYHKSDKIAWQYVSSKGFQDFLAEHLKPETHFVLLHTRAWTVGTPTINANNHPLTVGKSAIVHNGGIWNHKELFTELKLERKAETDSDIIRAIADAEGLTKKTIRTYQRMRGSCASAVIHKDFPRQMILMRSGSPLIYGHTYDDHLIWASTHDAVYKGSEAWRKRWGMWAKANKPELRTNVMPDHTAWLLDIDEMIANRDNEQYEPWHDKFEACKDYRAPNYDIHGKYKYKQEQKADELKKQAATVSSTNLETEIKKATESVAAIRTEILKNGGNKVDEFIACTKCKEILVVPPEVKDLPKASLLCPTCKTTVSLNAVSTTVTN